VAPHLAYPVRDAVQRRDNSRRSWLSWARGNADNPLAGPLSHKAPSAIQLRRKVSQNGGWRRPDSILRARLAVKGSRLRRPPRATPYRFVRRGGP